MPTRPVSDLAHALGSFRWTVCAHRVVGGLCAPYSLSSCDKTRICKNYTVTWSYRSSGGVADGWTLYGVPGYLIWPSRFPRRVHQPTAHPPRKKYFRKCKGRLNTIFGIRRPRAQPCDHTSRPNLPPKQGRSFGATENFASQPRSPRGQQRHDRRGFQRNCKHKD
jgi:hypothetical protein